MASLIENLITTLTQENDEYQKLLALSIEKTGIIVEGNHEALTAMVEKEQEVVGRINSLEKKRAEATKDIATVLGRNPKTLTLSNLEELLSSQKEECSAIKSIHDRLSDTMKRMVSVNDNNKALLKESLEMVEFEMNLVQSLKHAPSTANYAGNNYADNSYTANASFDAKQ